MSEKINFKKLEQSFDDKNLAASEIFLRLEALTVDMEFEAFMRENMISKYQRVKIPTMLVEPRDQSNPLKEASIFPERYRFHKGRFTFLHDLSADDWQLSAIFKTNGVRYKCTGDKDQFKVAQYTSKSAENAEPEIFEAKMGHHFLHSILISAGFDPEKFDLANWEKVCDTTEISSAILGNLANHYRYQTISRTRPIECPNGYTIVASQTESTDKVEGSDIISDINIDFLKDLAPTEDGRARSLNYTYQTFMDGNRKDMVTSRVTWQVLDGDVNYLGNNLEAAKLLQSNSHPDELNPVNNIMAWDNFMQVADTSLCYAMRET